MHVYGWGVWGGWWKFWVFTLWLRVETCIFIKPSLLKLDSFTYHSMGYIGLVDIFDKSDTTKKSSLFYVTSLMYILPPFFVDCFYPPYGWFLLISQWYPTLHAFFPCVFTHPVFILSFFKLYVPCSTYNYSINHHT